MKHLEIIHQLGQADSREAALAFDEFLRGAVRQSLVSVMAEEVTSLCGAAYRRSNESACRRAGSAPSSLEVEGEKIPPSQGSPRALRRHQERGELASYEAAKGCERSQIRDATIRAYTNGVATNGFGVVDGDEKDLSIVLGFGEDLGTTGVTFSKTFCIVGVR